MGAILWIARALIFLLLLRIVLRLIFGSMRGGSGQPGAGRSRSAERLGGELVRDPNCGTYIPKASAVVLGTGSDARYFCSDKCRNEYGEKLRTPKSGVRS
ncbi:MAG TPA: hypothetical protein VFV78_05260 [Vicinamibacterales bacterium]|nr:hypothetical protein [Vicinamibacterales bacterium]